MTSFDTVFILVAFHYIAFICSYGYVIVFNKMSNSEKQNLMSIFVYNHAALSTLQHYHTAAAAAAAAAVTCILVATCPGEPEYASPAPVLEEILWALVERSSSCHTAMIVKVMKRTMVSQWPDLIHSLYTDRLYLVCDAITSSYIKSSNICYRIQVWCTMGNV